ncbi:MAG: prepilin peptidase [Candidatus Falkowbacteria bacterium]|nr:MAG: prepilin peptidase [Candidatus Falkowbacteria bacterium]
MEFIFGVFAALIGLVIGSFLNCLVWRLYKEDTILGRSYCPSCSQTISWFDNIPLLSFLLLRGRCRHCRRSISWQYPLVEFFTALLFVLTFLQAADSVNFSLLLARDWFLISSLMIIFIYDFRWQMVPMMVVWPTTAIVAVLNLFLGFSWLAILSSGLVGAGFFMAQYILTKKRGIGEGDIWLGLLLGITFPTLSYLGLSLISAYFIGSIISVILLISKNKGWKSKIALGPFLVIGAIITLIYGQEIINWYLGLF